MIKFIVVIACLHLTIARPQGHFDPSSTTPATLLEYTVADDGAGNFNYSYKTSDGTSENAQGSLKDILVAKYDDKGQRVGDEQAKGLVQQGSYSFVAPDGLTYSVDWVADEEGFKPRAAHLPQPPQA